MSTHHSPNLSITPVATLAQAAADALQDAILSGRLPAGSPIRLEPTARALGMSLSPVREAIRELVRLGLVVQVPHKGAHVNHLSVHDLEDTYRTRLLLETCAVKLAAARFGPTDAQAAEADLARYAAALDAGAMREAREAHASFHFRLYTASGSRWLVHSIRPVWENSERYRFMTAASADALRLRDEEHRQILAACAARDGEQAAHLLHGHLAATASRVAEHMGGSFAA